MNERRHIEMLGLRPCGRIPESVGNDMIMRHVREMIADISAGYEDRTVLEAASGEFYGVVFLKAGHPAFVRFDCGISTILE